MRNGVPDIPIVDEKFGGGEPDRTILTIPLGSNNLPNRQSADSADLNERHQQILSVSYMR